MQPSYNIFSDLVPEANKPLEILAENLEYWEVQQKLLSKARTKRAKSMGSLFQDPMQKLIQIQDQLKRTNGNLNDVVNSDDEDESDHLENFRIDQDMDDEVDLRNGNGLPNDLQNEADTPLSVEYRPQSRGQQTPHSVKRVAFRSDVIVEQSVGSDRDNDPIMDDESERTVATPDPVTPPLSVKSYRLGVADKTSLTQTQSHQMQASESSSTMNPFDYIETMSLNGTHPLHFHSGKRIRAHSITVSIPTSEKQIEAQPKPFAEMLAGLRKEWEEQQEQNRHHQHAKTMTGIQSLQDTRNQPALVMMKDFEKPKVHQSVSVPVGGGTEKTFENKQKHDVV